MRAGLCCERIGNGNIRYDGMRSICVQLEEIFDRKHIGHHITARGRDWYFSVFPSTHTHTAILFWSKIQNVVSKFERHFHSLLMYDVRPYTFAFCKIFSYIIQQQQLRNTQLHRWRTKTVQTLEHMTAYAFELISDKLGESFSKWFENAHGSVCCCAYQSSGTFEI